MPDIMVFLYNDVTGIVAMLPSPLASLELDHGYAWHGPFKTRQEAIDYYNANKAANPNWKPPAGNVVDVIQNTESSVAGKITDAAGNVVTQQVKNIQDKFGPWFVRIGEVLLGLILIGVGIAKLTGTTNVVAKTVKAVIP